MNKFEQYAINFYVSTYPDNCHYETILQILSNNDNDITLWHYFKGASPDEVVGLIEEMKFSLMNTFE